MIWDDSVAQDPTPWPWRSVVPMPGPLPPHIIKANTLAALATQIQARLNALRGQRFFAAGVVPSVQLRPISWRTFRTRLHDSMGLLHPAWTSISSAAGRHSRMLGRVRHGARRGTVRCIQSRVPVPYYAVLLGAGTLDTCGGPITNVDGHVLRPDGSAVPGLFGAGNCVASAAGRGYWGAGGTIGPALVFGYLAGLGAANEPNHPQ